MLYNCRILPLDEIINDFKHLSIDDTFREFGNKCISGTLTNEDTYRRAIKTKVVRCFPGTKSDRFSDITQYLNNQPKVPTIPELINELVKVNLKGFNRENISAASKLLWPSNTETIVLYDSYAIKGLKVLDPNITLKYLSTYEGFYDIWFQQFDKVQIPDRFSKEEQLRIFDKYLMQLGRNK